MEGEPSTSAGATASSPAIASTSGPALVKTVSRVYANVVTGSPMRLTNYEEYDPGSDSLDKYELKFLIGYGTFSTVFVGVHNETQRDVIVKVLKPISSERMKREAKILQTLKGGINVSDLLSYIDLPPNRSALVFYRMPHDRDFRGVYLSLTKDEFKYYLYQLLRALDFCHSRGIMHRDVKPNNVVVDQRHRRIQLIDWGQAEFYLPENRFDTKVGTQFYKAPEMLLGYGYYDYSVDLWSLGNILASFLIQRDPLFKEREDHKILLSVTKILGTKGFYEILKKYNIPYDYRITEFGYAPKKPWEDFVRPEEVDGHGFSLLDSMLRYDHMQRITAREAMEHPFFDGIRPE